MNLIIEIKEQSKTAFVVHARIPHARLKRKDFEHRGSHLWKTRHIAELDFLIETGNDPMAGFARSCYTFVAESFRNRGIATKMYCAALGYCKACGLHGIYSIPGMRISKECDSVWKKIKSGRKNGNDIFSKFKKLT